MIEVNRREFLGVSLAALNSSWTLLASGNNVVVGDAHLQILLAMGEAGLIEKIIQVEGKTVEDLVGVPWVAQTGEGIVTGSRARVGLLERDPGEPSKRVLLEGKQENLRWSIEYKLIGPGLITKTVKLSPEKDLFLKTFSPWSVKGTLRPVVARTHLQDNAAIYRFSSSGLFASLDFPYSEIDSAGDAVTVSYPPHVLLTQGSAYSSHSVTVGSFKMRGQSRYGHDEGEVAALDAYVQTRYPIRFQRPQILTASINNRYTQVRGDIIFYTMKDHPTLRFNVDLMKRELELAPKLGIEYYQLFPGPFDWVADDPSPERVDEVVSYARKHGVRVGDYSGANVLFCAHYNIYRNKLDKPEWEMIGEQGPIQGRYCFGHPGFLKFYKDKVVSTAKRFGFEIHCLDFLNITPCYAESHGHPAGKAGIYHQVRGLIELMEGLNQVSPEMITWSNSGNWEEFLPKLAWFNPNLYLTDPYIRVPWQGLNMTRLLDDVRREQMVSLHHTHFIPYRFLTNCQYFFCQNSIVPDIRHYKFGALSTLAVTPNLCLGEIRPLLDSLTEGDKQAVIDFYRKWTSFLQKNFTLWTRTYQTGDNPGTGGVEVYSHAEGSRGFIFVINPNYWSRTIEIPLDQTLGFTGAGECEIQELFPEERLRLTDSGPFISLGERLQFEAPAQQVVILEIHPRPSQLKEPRIYGVTGTIESAAGGYLVRTAGPQGQSCRFAVVGPAGALGIGEVSVRGQIPKQPKREWVPTPVELLTSNKDMALIELTFRRQPAPTELHQWTVAADTFQGGLEKRFLAKIAGRTIRFPLFLDVGEVSLPLTGEDFEKYGMGPLANFCGGYIENAFSESQETWINLKRGPATVGENFPRKEKSPEKRSLDLAAQSKERDWWLETSFLLPFMYGMGAEPVLQDHTILVLPFVDPRLVSRVVGWANGEELEVRRYKYPRNPRLYCYYADLVGTGIRGGDNRLTLYFESR